MKGRERQGKQGAGRGRRSRLAFMGPVNPVIFKTQLCLISYVAEATLLNGF
jgi:hypothetical protein